MVTQSSPSGNIPAVYDETKPRNLRRSFTRLPVISTTPRGTNADESSRERTTASNARHISRSDIAYTTQRDTPSYSRSDNSNTSGQPRVAQAYATSDIKSIPTHASKARPVDRRSIHPPTSSIGTPSLVSGSTRSSQGSPPSVLRRKASTIDQYALRAKSIPESMQEHQHLVKTAYEARYDNDPFPGAIFGMTLPPTSEPSRANPSYRVAASTQMKPKSRNLERISRPVVDVGGPSIDAASSRHSDSPFSHHSTPTSASSFSSFPASSLGSSRNRDSQDLAPSERIQTQPRKGEAAPNASITEKATKPLTKLTSEKFQAKSGSTDAIRPSLSVPNTEAPITHKASNTPSSKKKMSKPAKIVGVPPEFAHLNVPIPESSSHKNTLPPRRPSRDGMIDLGLPDDTPVVQSNLERTYFAHIRRTPSHEASEAHAGSPPQSPRTIFGFSNRSSSRQSTRSQQSVSASAPKTPVQPPEPNTPSSRRDSPLYESSPEISKKSRFGASPRPVDKPIKSPKPENSRRGPAAGTGHEGYGRFGFRGRASSIFNAGRTSRSSSNDSSSSRRGLSFFSRKKSISSDVGDDDGQHVDEHRESLDAWERVGSTSLASSVDTVTRSTGAKNDGKVTPEPASVQTPTLELPKRVPVQHSLSDLGQEGKEGIWLASPKSSKDTTFMQRVRSKMTSQSSEIMHEPSGIPIEDQSAVPPSPHDTKSARKVPLDFQELERLVDVSGLSPQPLVGSHKDFIGREKPVPYQRRHEDLLPSLPRAHLQPSYSRPPPILLEASTATPAKAPQVVEIPRSQSPAFGPSDRVGRLRSVGRIPQIRKVVRDEQGTSQSKPALPASNEKGDTRNAQHIQPGSHFFDSIAQAGQEFLSFPPRKNSELSYTSSSGLESPCITRSSFVGEDEVWDEYDNLLDDVMHPKVRVSTTSSLGTPFQYGDPIDRRNTKSAPKSTRNSRVNKTDTNVDPGSPSTTFTISDYLVDQERAKSQVSDIRLSYKAGAVPSESYQPGLAKSSDQSTTYDRVTVGQITGEPDMHTDSPASAELRFAALMTNKWLSFGRVLFSPAHDEATMGDGTRILILDGLGKEWSYHCALTYPKCQIYNLSPEISSSWETLPNHHHIQHSSISKPFPFPRGFFSAIVFRFPVADSDDAYQSCFHEMKRTLRPSGYLEISVLDLDLMSMSSIARKAVRDLKIRMHHNNSQVSLWNHGDAFLTMLGKKGLENIQRCAVGIPVAGRIRKSQDGGNTNNRAWIQRKRTQSEIEPDYFKFTEWMQGKSAEVEDEYHERRHDEDITKTVAKIGRWWYSSCYPEPEASDKHNDIWETPGLLRECERQRTSFRLLFCYAQKPMCVKRRTASV